MSNGDHVAVLNVSYMTHKSLMYTVHSLVKNSQLAKPVSVGW